MTDGNCSYVSRGDGTKSGHPLSAKELSEYHRSGFLYIPEFLSQQEISPLQDALEKDPSLDGNFSSIHEGDAVGSTDFMAWTGHADDFIGCVTRMRRIVDATEALIGEAIYHYHSKMVRKPGHSSGEVGWHQDFSGWYQDGCLFPKMLTCVIAVTPATPTNGCLKMIKGSHEMGRIDRIAGAHSYYSVYPQRLNAILKRFQPVEIEMQPGDGLFFHCNTLHASSPNRTDKPRVLLELSYNAVSNEPVFEGQAHHRVKPLDKVADTVLQNIKFNTTRSRTRFVKVNDPNDPGYSIFSREHLPAQC